MKKDNIKRQRRAAEGKSYNSESSEYADAQDNQKNSSKIGKEKEDSFVPQETEEFKVPKPKAPFNTDMRVNESNPTPNMSLIANQN